MTTRIECPSCGAKLKLKNLDVLLRGVSCPGCRNPLPRKWPPEDGEVLESDVIEIVEDENEPNDSGEPQPEECAEPPDNLFLRIHTPSISMKEYWWGVRNPLIIIAWLIKLFRIPVPSSTNDPPVVTLRPFEATFDAFTKGVRKEIEQPVMTLKSRGFRDPVLHRVSDTTHGTDYSMVTVRHEKCDAIARIMHRHWKAVYPHKRYLICSFITAFDDGTFLVTTNEQPDMTWPATIELHRNQQAEPLQLWEMHQELLSADTRSTGVRQIRDRRDSVDVLEAHHEQLRDFHTQRRVFRAPGASKRKKTETVNRRSNSSSSAQPHADVLAEIETQQNGQAGWGKGLMLLVFSAALFLGLGAANWSWKTVWILLPVLFVHELGHYLAMKTFGYRNLKMFFIPLFGAAVSGQHYNVAGWKKAVVSLAGPVPGIFLGTILGTVGLIRGIDIAVEIAVMTLILNALNLIPVLPLDGGWIAHSLFFSRHYSIDVAFRIVTAVILLGVSAAIGDRFLIGLGVFMVIGIPTVLRTGRIIHRLKGQLSTISDDEQNIPTETAVRIIEEIENDFPAGSLNTKTLAQTTLNIFQSLNTNTPGIGSTLALSAVHAASFLWGFVMLSVLIVGQLTDFGDLLNVAAMAPETAFECGSSEITVGPEATLQSDEVCVVASFEDTETAVTAFQKLNEGHPATGTSRLFGQTLLLALPADADQLKEDWIGRLEGEKAKVAVRSDAFSVPFSITFISQDEQQAEQIEKDLSLYFYSTWIADSLIPPWSPNDQISEDQRKARETLQRLQGNYHEDDVANDVADDSMDEVDEKQNETVKLYQELATARRLGNKADVAAIQKQLNAINEKAEQNRIDGIRALGPEKVDQKLVDLYRQQPQYQQPVDGADPGNAYKLHQEARKEWTKTLAPLLGHTVPAGDASVMEHKKFGTASGYSSRAGLLHRIDGMVFHREVDGIAALADWLCEQGCVDIKYRFGSAFDEEDF